MAKGWQEGRQTRQVEAPAEDGLVWSSSSRVETESAKADQTEGGARTETGGPWSRRSQPEQRPPPWWRLTVEPTEGGPLVKERLTTPGCWPTAAEQVEEEPEAETESRWTRATGRIRRAKAEQMAPATEAKAGIWKATVEPEWQRTKVEPEGRSSLTEPEGWGVARGVESRGGGWSTTDQGGAGGTREPGGAGGLKGHGGDEGARSHGGATGSKGQGTVRDSEAGGGDKGSSSHDADGD